MTVEGLENPEPYTKIHDPGAPDETLSDIRLGGVGTPRVAVEQV